MFYMVYIMTDFGHFGLNYVQQFYPSAAMCSPASRVADILTIDRYPHTTLLQKIPTMAHSMEVHATSFKSMPMNLC